MHHVHVHTVAAWTLRDVSTAFVMWLLMAVAMMLPTAIPATVAFADIAKAGARDLNATARVGSFVSGYLLAWWGFGALATAVQWMLASAVRHSAGFAAQHPLSAGLLVMASGVYQFSALKDYCLTQCRSPLTFFLAHWRDGLRGAVSLGVHHGAHCIGCCWALMALMLLGGTMSLGWTAALSVVMLLEKAIPGGRILSRIVGITLIVGGAVLIGSPLIERGFT